MNKNEFRTWDSDENKFRFFNFKSADLLWMAWNILDFDKNTQQFTGLKDKEGKKIFEGDIVKLDDEVIGDIFWDDACFQIRLNENQGRNHFIQDRAARFTIIGNIFENPELLEK